jgi:hypothetical protein
VQDNIIAGAKSSFLAGDQWAYTAGIVAVLAGAAIVFFFFPKTDRERELLASYQAENADPGPGGETVAPHAPPATA